MESTSYRSERAVVIFIVATVRRDADKPHIVRGLNFVTNEPTPRKSPHPTRALKRRAGEGADQDAGSAEERRPAHRQHGSFRKITYRNCVVDHQLPRAVKFAIIIDVSLMQDHSVFPDC